MNILDPADHESAILESIHSHAAARPVRQRDLAGIVGISLGMTNVIIRKLAQKGWVKIRKINNRNISYAVTPAGLEEISRRSFKFLKRTVKNVVYYKQILDNFLVHAKNRQFKGILLIGESDFDFIIAHLCHKRGLVFAQSRTDEMREGYLSLYSEDRTPSRAARRTRTGPSRTFLKEILVRDHEDRAAMNMPKEASIDGQETQG